MTTNRSRFATALVVAGIAIAVAVAFTAVSVQDAQAQAKFTRRVSGSWAETSASHDAEGHSAHQVVYMFSPQAGAVYNGMVTFSSSKGVDIIAMHDITDQATNVTGLKTWKVDGRTYAITTLMTNATSGTVNFVGSGLLAHSAASDTYSVAFSADGLAKKTTLSSYMMNGQGMMHGQGNGMMQ